ncbi:MAG: hypothetical protein SFY66_17850 [Oculatellaceae cyanobacterium bins.114]|nr:hypothetical protein [Oculatellaceae cyanobacterium bins.114]
MQKIKASIRTNAPLFNTDRRVADYMAQMYVLGNSTHKPTLARVPV